MNYYNYFTEIEEHFVRRRGKSLLVSPLDWSLIAAWRDSGIPLHVALRGIDKAMDAFAAKKTRNHQKVNSLFYCHASVAEEYAHHLESHVGAGQPTAAAGADDGEAREPAAARPEFDKQQIERFLSKRIAEIKSLLSKHSASEATKEEVGRVLERLMEIATEAAAGKQPDLETLERDLRIQDEALMRILRPLAPADEVKDWESEARKALKVYRKRLQKETYHKIFENFMREKLRRYFDLGELSLFHL